MLTSIHVTFPSSLPFVCSQAVSSYKGMFTITGFLQITILTVYKTSFLLFKFLTIAIDCRNENLLLQEAMRF